MITQHYMIDLIPAGDPVVVHVSQYDKLARILAFDLYTGGVAFEPPAGATAQIRGTKPDGTVFNYAMTVSGITVSIPIPQQMALVAGDVICEIQITGNGSAQIGTANFILRVERSALDEEAAESSSDIPLFEELTQQATTAAASAAAARDAAVTAAAEAEALIPATGTEGAFLQKSATGSIWTTVPAGHAILNELGEEQTQRSYLQFIGAEVYDQPDDLRTVVDIVGSTDLKVSITYTTGSGYAVDKTYAEILQNITDGGTPYVEYSANGGTPSYYLLRAVTDTYALFGSPGLGGVNVFYVYSTGSVSYSTIMQTVSGTVTLPASAWSNGQATLSWSYISANNVIELGYPVTISDADYEVMRAADIRVTAQGAGFLTLKALGTVPESALTFQLTRW